MDEYLIRFHSTVTGGYRHTISRAPDLARATKLAKSRLNSPSYACCTLVWVKRLKDLVPT